MKRITAMLLMICLCLMGQSVLAEEKVGKIAVAQEPTKMDYWVGEEFSAEGGVLLVEHWESASLQQAHLAGAAMERLKQLKERFGVVTARVERYEETGD